MAAALLAVCVFVGTAAAQADRTAYFINLLNTSSSFRVRAQAALALGRVETSAEVRQALSSALRDDEPAVRAAAASAIERLGDRQMLAAVQSARRSERDGTVRAAEDRAIAALSQPDEPDTTPSGPARYYVGVGLPGDRGGTLSRDEREQLRRFLESKVGEIEGVRIAPEGESNAAATRALGSNRLTGYFIDASVVSIEENSSGVSARVSVILATYPTRDMRAMLSGGARVPNGSGSRAAMQAIQGALQGALRQLPQAMRAADARASR